MNNCFTLPTGEYVPLENIDYIGAVVHSVYKKNFTVYLKSLGYIYVEERRGGDGLGHVSGQDIVNSHKEICADLEMWLENKNNKLLNK